MKHIRKFESYSKKRKLNEIIKESVMIVDDLYRVNVTADIPQSLLNAYIKKVKDGLDKNARQFFSDVQLAEEITKHVLQQGLNIDKLEASALFGGAQAQGQSGQIQVQSQAQAQVPVQAQAPVQAQVPAQGQVPPQAQAQAPVQGQVAPQAQGQMVPQDQPQGQGQMAPQAQGQGQMTPQAQPQGQAPTQDEEDDEFEEVNDDDDELPV